MLSGAPIIVEVFAHYAPEHSAPEHDYFVFIYEITIRNVGGAAARLISRHWIITDAEEKRKEVRGEGVVGEQPLIAPGGEYRYSSYCVLPTRVGCMSGSYMMQGEDGLYFDAPIPAFTLALPGTLN